MKILQEFKEFAMRGNVVDLAVGVIIGGAFGKIVTSVVNDIIMPPIGVVLGGVDFKDLFIPLKPIPEDKVVNTLDQAASNHIPVIAYGQFINVILDFLIVAACVFLLVKGINFLRNARKQEEAAPAAPAEKECPYCLSQVPVKATRCKYCTSELEGPQTETGHAHG